MKIENFLKIRPYLYHLTERDNIDIIKENYTLYSAINLISSSDLTYQEKEELISSRRLIGKVISQNGRDFHIRDQQPLIEKSLEKSLTGGMTKQEYIELLNSKVFFWPTINRLNKHYERYANDNIAIIRVSTKDLLDINKGVEFARINSGATRSVPFYRGAHPRGSNTFLSLSNYRGTPGKVAEVVFTDQCQLPKNIELGDTPDGKWESIN